MNFHFKFALRDILKNRLITLGSLTSLVVGVLCTFLIYLWVDSELSTDEFHSNRDRIFVPVMKQSPTENLTAFSIGEFFDVDYKQYPGIEKKLFTAYFNPQKIKLTYNEQEYRGGGLVADSTFFDFFDFKLKTGNPDQILDDPSHILLTESFAKQVFGDKDPIGKTLYLQSNKNGYYQVAGIMENLPSNSTLSFDFLVPTHSQDMWFHSGMEFILVNSAFNQSDFNEEIRLSGRKHFQFKESELSTVPFRDVYFNYNLNQELLAKHGNMNEVKTMLLVALVILLVSVLNFTNMQTTLVFSQLKTKGIKQVNGATKSDFFMELVASRVIYAIVGTALVFALFQMIKPAYLNFLQLTFDRTWFEVLGLVIIGVLLFTFISTIFSLFQSSRVITSQALMGQLSKKDKGRSGRVLTTIQYVFAIALIIVTAVVYKQFKYMEQKNLGYDPSGIVSIKFFDRIPYNFENPEITRQQEEDQNTKYEFVQNELGKMPGVLGVSQGVLPISENSNPFVWKPAAGDFEYSEANNMTVDPNYFNVLGLRLYRGRFFSDSLDMPAQTKVVINKAAMEYWGIKDIEDAKLISTITGGERRPYTIIGVVEDFNFEHLSKKVEPAVMMYLKNAEREFDVKIDVNQFGNTMKQISELYSEINPKQVFTYSILEDKLKAQYEREEKLSDTFMLFTLIALIVSSIGLFTFALYETRKRTKEIGIRKVIGANVNQVIGLLSGSFLQWVLLAFIIACPLGWYFMSAWLANFANQTELSWWIFAGAGFLTSVLALFTVIGQSYVVARRNPVEALRYE